MSKQLRERLIAVVVARVVFVLVAFALVGGVGFYAGQKNVEPLGEGSRERAETAPAPDTGVLALPPGEASRTFHAALMARDPLERLQRLVSVLQSVGPEDAADLQATIEPRLADLSEIEVGLFLQWWVLHDPEAALAWAQVELPEEVKIYVRIALAAWAQADFEAARDYLARSPVEPSASSQIALVRGGYDGGYPGLDAYVADIESGTVQQSVLYALAKRIAIRDGSPATMAWAEGLPDDDPQFKLRAYRRVGKALAVFDFPAGREWAQKHRFGGYGSLLLSMVARNEARKAADPRETVLWLVDLPGAPDLSTAIADAFASWLKRDRDNAWAWLLDQGTSPWLDGVRVMYAAQLLDTQGSDAAFAMVDEIQDEDERRRALVGVVARWWRQDPNAAEPWIATADLDHELLEKIRSRTVDKR